MPTTLPVPITFALPNEHWEAVVPESLGVTNAAFLAVRRQHLGDGYAPTLTISGDLRADGASLDQVADEAVEVLAQQANNVELVKRNDYGSEQAPGVLQVVAGQIEASGRSFDVRQAQVLLEMRDVSDPERRAIVKIVLSTTYAQFETYLPELQELMRSLRPDQPESA